MEKKGEGDNLKWRDLAYMNKKIEQEFGLDKMRQKSWLEYLNDFHKKKYRSQPKYQDVLKEQESHLFDKDGFLYGNDPRRNRYLR